MAALWVGRRTLAVLVAVVASLGSGCGSSRAVAPGGGTGQTHPGANGAGGEEPGDDGAEGLGAETGATAARVTDLSTAESIAPGPAVDPGPVSHSAAVESETAASPPPAGRASAAPGHSTGKRAPRSRPPASDSGVRAERRAAESAPPPAEPLAASRATSPRRLPTAPALRAGRHDDNNEYNRFIAFLRENAAQVPLPVPVEERLTVRALDRDGRSLHGCSVVVGAPQGAPLWRSTTYADGGTHFFPQATPGEVPGGATPSYGVEVVCGQQRQRLAVERRGPRTVEARFPHARTVPAQVPVDVAIVLDTTGSMGGQIARLRQTLQAIHFQLSELPSRPDLRFGLVAYRDRGDAYVTELTQFTADVDDFQRVLDALEADGGGDTPEDLHAGLDQALHALTWRPQALKIGFVIADAPPHVDYDGFSYRDAMWESLERGIKWVTVGAGGLPLQGEIVFRQLAQLTMGEYVFVTQSATAGDSSGGHGEASHHVGANYSVENLDQAMVRVVRRELSYLTDTPRDFDNTIVADGPRHAANEVLAEAARELLRQLVDYSSLRIEHGTPTAVVPVAGKEPALGSVAEYVTDQLVLAASRQPALRLVERDLEAVAQELKLQLGELTDPAQSVSVGKMIGAELLVVTKLTVHKGRGELFAKLVRVETAEILSVAKASLDGRLLPPSS